MAGVQAIERAFVLLRALAIGPAGITELADRVGLPKSTVSRLLASLETERVVAQKEVGGTYELGPLLSELSGARSDDRSLVALARPYLVELASRTGESAGLDIFERGSVHFVDEVSIDQQVQVRDWTGESGPAHSLPSGIAILAHTDAGVVKSLFDNPLEALTASTIVDPASLARRLDQVRSAGYCWGFEEFAIGINSVAAPVFGPLGVEGALRIHGPTYRFPNPNDTHDIGMMLVESALGLSHQLGQPPPATSSSRAEDSDA